MVAVAALPTLDDLRQFVRQTLADHDQLDPAQAPLHEGPISRRGRACGRMFVLDGPHLLKSYAVWAGDEHRLLFYDSTGQRFAEVRLSEAPEPAVTGPR
jgi:hypothetical protein